jgi:hypothetical protein
VTPFRNGSQHLGVAAGQLPVLLRDACAEFQGSALVLVAEAVAQTPGEPAGSLLRVGCENGRLIRREHPVHRQRVPHGCSGVPFRQRAGSCSEAPFRDSLRAEQERSRPRPRLRLIVRSESLRLAEETLALGCATTTHTLAQCVERRGVRAQTGSHRTPRPPTARTRTCRTSAAAKSARSSPGRHRARRARPTTACPAHTRR